MAVLRNLLRVRRDELLCRLAENLRLLRLSKCLRRSERRLLKIGDRGLGHSDAGLLLKTRWSQRIAMLLQERALGHQGQRLRNL